MMSSSASCNLESQSARVQDTRTTIAFSVEMSAHSRREEAKRNHLLPSHVEQRKL
jgi:hypothetical protein